MIAPLSERQKKRLAAQLDILRKRYKPEDTFTLLDAGTEFGHTGRTVKAEFPNAIIDGVEIHLPMLEACRELHGKSYDRLFSGDVVVWLRPVKKRYDVIIAAEIIEHFPKAVGRDFLRLLESRCGLAIVTSPIGFKAQQIIHDNPHEIHLSGWEPVDFPGWTVHMLDPLGYTLGIYYRENS